MRKILATCFCIFFFTGCQLLDLPPFPSFDTNKKDINNTKQQTDTKYNKDKYNIYDDPNYKETEDERELLDYLCGVRYEYRLLSESAFDEFILCVKNAKLDYKMGTRVKKIRVK